MCQLQFKQRVVNKLPHDYMKQDIYLIRWLRGKTMKCEQKLLTHVIAIKFNGFISLGRNFNIEQAEQMLLEV